MKNFHIKIFTLLIFSLGLQGCMPDSLTKFTKNTPVKAGAPAPVTVTNAAGTSVALADIIPPTTFSYNSSTNDLVFVLNTANSFPIIGDNAFLDDGLRNSIIQNCTVSPLLPLGVSIDPKTCAISATTSAPLFSNTAFNVLNKGKADFIVTVTYTNSQGGTSTLSSAIKLQVIAKPTLLTYSQSPKVVLQLSGDLSSFSSASGPFTTSDSKTSSDITKNSISGTVETIDKVNFLLGVINLKNYDYQDTPTLYTDANLDFQPDTAAYSQKYYFKVGDTIDSDIAYYQKRAQIDEIRNIYPTKASAPNNINLQPLEDLVNNINVNLGNTTRNYLDFTISPKLPTGFTFDPLNGKISGFSAIPLPLTTYTITASNSLGSVSTTVKFEVIEAPVQVAYTRKQLLTISTLAYSYLKEGDSVVSQIVSPKISSTHGLITKMISPNLIEVLTLDGTFAKNDPLDIGKTFNAIVTSVLATPINFNAALTTAVAVTVPAAGEIIGDMYVQYLSAPATSRVYVTATGTTSIATAGAMGTMATTISEIDAESLMVTLTAPPITPDLSGFEVLSTIAKARGYVYSHSGSNIYLSDIFRSVNASDVSSRNFKQADSLVFDERSTGAGPVGTIGGAGAVVFDNYYAAERGIYFEIQPNLKMGTGVTYSITPALPAGITLNAITGLLSGTPTISSTLDNYVISAKNLAGVSTLNLKFEVRDYFTLSEVSGAPSFNLHKVGDYQNNKQCKINSSDIYNNRGNLDLRCFMDGEEEDIHFFGMKLKANVGPAICQFVSITPHHFWKWAPKTTNATVVRWVNTGTVLASDRTITSEQDCDGNYSLENGPNCDAGSITVKTYAFDAAAAPALQESFVSSEVISCGGKASNCLDGPIKDIITDPKLATGVRSEITNGDSGFDKTWSFSTPGNSQDLTNLRIANNLYTTNATGGKCDAGAVNTNLAINSNYTNLNLYTKILDTTAPSFYTPGTDTDYYGSSHYIINGFPRGLFTTENNARSIKPYKITKVYSKVGPFDGTLPYYQVNCLDSAKEIRATVNIVVRDWNKTFKLQSEIDKEEPDTALTALTLPILMRATAGGTVANPVNDFADWNDDYSSSPTPVFGAANAPIYPACGTRPAYAIPATSAAVPTMVFPAAAEFQFPENSL